MIITALVLTLAAAGSSPAQINPEQSKGAIYSDPSRKMGYYGQIHIVKVRGNRLDEPTTVDRALINLKEAMHRWTDIQVTIDRQLNLDSPKIHQYPFLYIAFDGNFELTGEEEKNLGAYMENGGFVVFENTGQRIELSPEGAAFGNALRNILGSRGRFSPIDNNHPLYHSAFDFDDGPPLGDELRMSEGYRNPEITFLEGLTFNNRLLAVFSFKRYVNRWHQISGNIPQLKIGVNMIMYALINADGRVLRLEPE